MSAFADDLKRLGQSLPKDLVSEELAATASHALRRVIERSPVATGRFRGNWVVSTRPTVRATRATDASGGATIAAGEARIAELVAADPFRKIYVTNGLPYSLRIEYGSSTQAPQGVVAITAAELALLKPSK